MEVLYNQPYHKATIAKEKTFMFRLVYVYDDDAQHHMLSLTNNFVWFK